MAAQFTDRDRTGERQMLESSPRRRTQRRPLASRRWNRRYIAGNCRAKISAASWASTQSLCGSDNPLSIPMDLAPLLPLTRHSEAELVRPSVRRIELQDMHRTPARRHARCEDRSVRVDYPRWPGVLRRRYVLLTGASLMDEPHHAAARWRKRLTTGGGRASGGRGRRVCREAWGVAG